MRRCNLTLSALVLLSATGLAGAANAAISVNANIGGAPPAGMDYQTFNSLTAGSSSSASLANGLSLSFTSGDSKAVSGSTSQYAAPDLSGNNGTHFAQGNGIDATTYLTTGTGSLTLAFALPTNYIGLLWGSVDDYNTLKLYNGNTLVGTVTGNDVTHNPNGDQGVNGTFYVNINSTLAFNRVVASSTSDAFEIDDLAFDPPAPVPEPLTLSLFGAGLAGLGMMRRKSRKA